MNLLVDVGNSRIDWAVTMTDSGFTTLGSFAHDDNLLMALDHAWGGMPCPDRLVVANVAGAATATAIQGWTQTRWSATPDFVSAGAAGYGINNCYRVPADLGSDRWAAMIGARQLTHDAFCVVDCGTALTVDAVDAQGKFIGGAIVPGLQLMRTALLERASGVHATTGASDRLPACGTAEAVSAGTLYAFAGAIERIVTEYTGHLGTAPAIYVTGGDALNVRPLLGFDSILVPDLVLQGLAVIADQGI